MADEEEIVEDDEPKKKSKKPMLIGLILALVLGGGGFYAVQSGMILAPAEEHAEEMNEVEESGPMQNIAFVPIQPLTVNLGDKSNRFLRFHAQLEVNKPAEPDVTLLLPRIVDVLNSYLRAVGTDVLEDPTALVRMRAHMLRRIQVVTGSNQVRDLLIMEFVLN